MSGREKTKNIGLFNRWMASVAMAVAVVAAVSSLSIASAHATGCEIVWDSDVSYSVVRSSESVLVDAVLTVADHQWDSSCGPVWVSFAVVPSASEFTAGGPVGVSVERLKPSSQDSSATASLTFDTLTPDDISGGVSLSYVMRSDGDWVTMDSSSATFPAWAIDAAGGGTVTVGTGFHDVVVFSTDTGVEPSLGTASADLSDSVLDAYASVWFGDYERSEVGSGIVYFAESESPDPRRSVIGGASESLLLLEEMFGRRSGIGRDIGIIEVSEGALAGYAGRYSEEFGTIEIPAGVGQGTLIHELAHAWFNDAVFADPWMSEGLADLASVKLEQTMIDTDGEPWMEISRPSFLVPLAGWDAVDVVGDASESAVDYGYEAAAYVMDSVAREIGDAQFFDHVANVISEATESGTPVDSASFVVGLQRALGFEDDAGVYATYVLGSTTLPDPTAPPVESIGLVDDAGGVEGESSRVLLVAGVIALVAIVVIILLARSLHTKPRLEIWDRATVEGYDLDDLWTDLEFASVSKGGGHPDDDWLV